MTTKTDITLPLLPGALVDVETEARAYARAAVEADRQGRTVPSAAEISSVIREITGHPDIKIGHESLVVKLSFLFARYGQPAASAEPNTHIDDDAVDHFAAAMKDKLAKARAKGRHGWHECPPEDLSAMLRAHVEKGDPRDVANFCMFLWSLGQPISAAPVAQEPVMWASPETLEAMALHRQNNFPAGGMGLACRAGSATVPLYAAPVAAQKVDMDAVRAWQEAQGIRQPADSRESRMVVLRHNTDGKPTVWCDPEIADLVDALNNGNLATVASCSGHDKRPGSIILSDGRELIIAKDFDEARAVERCFPGVNGEPPDAAQAQPIMPPLTDAMRAVLRNEHCVYDSEDALYAALVTAAQMQSSGNPGELDERAAFEWWASDEGENPLAIERDGNGNYKLAQIQSHWDAWQARAALAQQPSAQDREDAAALRAILMESPEAVSYPNESWTDAYAEWRTVAIDAARAAKGGDHG